MRLIICFATAAAVAVVPPALAQTTGGQGTNQGTPQQQAPAGTVPGMSAAVPSDKEFVTAAAIANRFEIMEAQLALSLAREGGLNGDDWMFGEPGDVSSVPSAGSYGGQKGALRRLRSASFGGTSRARRGTRRVRWPARCAQAAAGHPWSRAKGLHSL